LAAQFEDIKEIVTMARRMTKAINDPGMSLIYRSTSFIKENKQLIKSLSRLKEVIEETGQPSGLRLPTVKYELYISADKAKGQLYLDKLKQDEINTKNMIEVIKTRLASSSYVENAPKDLVAASRSELEEKANHLELLTEELKIITDWVNS
jgi:valyl-tRNA synthetase